jgi:DNA-binding transcriptional MerR regulator
VTKGPLAFRTISETAEILGVQQHVLRFWESKFPFIRPTKRAGGRRFYRPQDIAVLSGVKTLLHERGYTIRGVQKLYKDHGQKALLSPNAADDPLPDTDFNQADAPVHTTAAVSGPQIHLGPDLKAQFLEIADALEEAQRALGAVLGRHKVSD